MIEWIIWGVIGVVALVCITWVLVVVIGVKAFGKVTKAMNDEFEKDLEDIHSRFEQRRDEMKRRRKNSRLLK
jgi:type VI protein secretion system component VasK